jgi:hypothetical protein
MPGVEDVKLHISASVDEVDRAVAGIRGVLERVDDALARLRFAVVGTAHPRALDAILRLEEVRQKLIEAQTLALGSIDAAQEYRAGI